MAKRRYRKRKCKCCRHWYMPQPHNAYQQRYCIQRICRLASRRDSQRRYNRAHPDRYKGRADVLRVRNWREEHPYYWRRMRRRRILHMELSWCENRPRRRLRIVQERWLRGALRNLYLSQLTLPRRVTTGLDHALHNLISLLPALC